MTQGVSAKAGISLCIVFHTTSSSAKEHFRRVGSSPHRSTFCNNTIHYSHCFLFHICFLISSPFPPMQQQHGCTTVRPICPPSDLTHTLLQQVITSTATPGPNVKYICLKLFPQTLITPSPVLKKLLKFIMRDMIIQDRWRNSLDHLRPLLLGLHRITPGLWETAVSDTQQILKKCTVIAPGCLSWANYFQGTRLICFLHSYAASSVALFFLLAPIQQDA